MKPWPSRPTLANCGALPTNACGQWTHAPGHNYEHYTPIMENQMEKKMENGMETGIIMGYIRAILLER